MRVRAHWHDGDHVGLVTDQLTNHVPQDVGGHCDRRSVLAHARRGLHFSRTAACGNQHQAGEARAEPNLEL